MRKSRQGPCPCATRSHAGKADVYLKIYKQELLLAPPNGTGDWGQQWGAPRAMSKNVQVVESRGIRIS